MRNQQLPVHPHLTFQGVDLGVSALDQSDKLANHARAFDSKGCESLVLICEISACSGVTGKLGVAGCPGSGPCAPWHAGAPRGGGPRG